MSSEPLYVDVLHLTQRYSLVSEESSPSADVHLLEFVEALYKDLTGNVGEKSYSHPACARQHGLSTNYGSGRAQHVPTLKALSYQNGLPLLATLVLYHGPNMTYAATVLERQRWGTYALGLWSTGEQYRYPKVGFELARGRLHGWRRLGYRNSEDSTLSSTKEATK
ncbi:hypothetical protein CPB85DRAFT_1326477 [Mucidula mucida]|nr:hypothetical protein CPB85DRAFT_1326477 [Mucidula mucida]